MKQTYSISKLIQKQSFTLCTYNSTFYNLIGALRLDSIPPHVTVIQNTRPPFSHVQEHLETGLQLYVMIGIVHAINYLTTTNLGVVSARP